MLIGEFDAEGRGLRARGAIAVSDGLRVVQAVVCVVVE